MIRRPPISTRTDTLFPYTTLFRSRVRVLPAWISTIRSPAASVSLSLAFSLAPAGYLLADGPVERTTIDWAAAVPARATAATAATDPRARSGTGSSGQDLALPSFVVLHVFPHVQTALVTGQTLTASFGAGSNGQAERSRGGKEGVRN